jgi:hypothetical protein
MPCLSEDTKRFILTSIDSVPHLEAILLLRQDPDQWDAKKIAQTLYITEKRADEILADLCSSQFVSKIDSSRYHYQPVSKELRQRVDDLADSYCHHLIEVTNLIHSKTNKQAQQFGDAFKWETGKE